MSSNVVRPHLDSADAIMQSSLAQLQSCIENQDWESAARCCARAMSLPFTIISGPFAESVVVSNHSETFQTPLTNLSSLQLRVICLQHRPCRLHENNFYLFSRVTSKKHLAREMLQLRLVISNSFLLLVGRQKASRPMHRSWLILCE